MAEGPTETIRRVFDRWAEGDFAAGADDLDSHVVFVVRNPFPESGVFYGRLAVGGYMRDFLAQFERLTISAERIETVGDTVVVEALQRGRGKRSGAETEIRYHQLFTFRGPTIVRVESILDRDEAFSAVGR